jgi:hypothetical protein
MRTTAGRFWNAIIIAGAGLAGCNRDALPAGTGDMSAVAAVDGLTFQDTPDMAVDPDLAPPCMPDLRGANVPGSDAFDPAKGCLPGAPYDNLNFCTGDECGNCVPCFI